jgi:hypothetical protein
VDWRSRTACVVGRMDPQGSSIQRLAAARCSETSHGFAADGVGGLS